MAGEPLPPGLVAQGGAMLRAVTEDFVVAGVEVVTTCDARLDLPLASTDVRQIESAEDLSSDLNALFESSDAVLVIAPECGGVLTCWLEQVEALGARSLGCRSDAAALCGDKLQLTERLVTCDVPTPRTSESIDLPGTGELVIKPRDGAGCEHTYVFAAADAARLFANGQPTVEPLVVQPYHVGRPMSVSLIATDDRPVVLAVGEQLVTREDTLFGYDVLRYRGGIVPIVGGLAERADALAREAVSAVAGLRGWVGVDVLLADDPDDDVVIEINPRLTMSYLGLREVCDGNLAQLLLDIDAPCPLNGRRVEFDAAGRIVERSA